MQISWCKQNNSEINLALFFQAHNSIMHLIIFISHNQRVNENIAHQDKCL